MEAVVFDIETSTFEAIGSGMLLCVVAKPLHGRRRIFRYDEMKCRPFHEKRMVKEVLDYLGGFDLLIGHNVDYFDWHWLVSRAVQFDLPRPKPPFTYDTFKAFRRLNYKTPQNWRGKPRASLGDVADFFDIPQRKTPIYSRQHWKSIWGEKGEREKAMRYIVDHCKADVALNVDVYWRVMRADDPWVAIRRLK